MFDTNKAGGKLFAAVISLGLSTIFFATAIIPATPNGVFA